jgi:hypothetical protein
MANPETERYPIAVVISELDNLLLEPYWRIFQTYQELGWDADSIHAFLSKKENKTQLASFTTPQKNFTGPNRREEYEATYNRMDMLDKDTALPGTTDMLQILTHGAYVVVLSARPIEQESRTRQVMQALGFPIDQMEFNFKEPDESVMNFRKRCFQQLGKRFQIAIGICLYPSDTINFDRLRYPTMALTTLKNAEAFSGTIDLVCNDWNQIAGNFIQLVKSMSPAKLEQARAKLAESTPKRFAFQRSVADIAAQFEADKQFILPTTSAYPDLTMNTADIFQNAEDRGSTQNLLDQAVFMQLFSSASNETILGKNENESIKIENVEYILNMFMTELKAQLPLIRHRQIAQFFSYFSQRLQVDLSDVQMMTEINLEAMGGVENAENADYFIAVTKLVEKLRNMSFEHFGMGWVAWIFYETTGKTFEGPIKEKFLALADQNDPDIGILFNVSFILWLTKLYPDTPYSEPIQTIVKNHTKKIIGRLFM